MPVNHNLRRDATFSRDNVYVYAVYRSWAETAETVPLEETVVWIGMCPFARNETGDDTTMKRCIRFTDNLGYQALYLVNLFGHRQADFRTLRSLPDPVGPENDQVIHFLARRAAMVIACWGDNWIADERRRQFLAQVDYPLYCLGVTSAGHPRHPVHLSFKARPMPFNVLQHRGRPASGVLKSNRFEEKLAIAPARLRKE